MKYDRGGKSLENGDIGHLAIPRQVILYPGETLRARVNGSVKLSAMRQQATVYLHARLDAFAAPIRWYDTGWAQFVKDGPIDTAYTASTLDSTWQTDDKPPRRLGIGRIENNAWEIFALHPQNVWNEYFRWPEDAKESITTPRKLFFGNAGPECVNLPSAPTRVKAASDIHDDEVKVSTVTGDEFDVRNLALIQSRFGQAAKSDWSSMDRYIPFMQDIWGAKGNREVDKIPIRLRGAALSVTPEDLYATDGPSLGEISSLNNFGVSHDYGSFTATEHTIICFTMLLRFSPVFASGISPFAYPTLMGTQALQGDPNLVSMEQPRNVTAVELGGVGTSTIGRLPAGWQMREGYTHVAKEIDEVGNFPLLDSRPTTAAEFRKAGAINNTFRSNMLREWNADLDFKLEVSSRFGPSKDSIMTGSKGHHSGGLKGNHPTGGFLS